MTFLKCASSGSNTGYYMIVSWQDRDECNDEHADKAKLQGLVTVQTLIEKLAMKDACMQIKDIADHNDRRTEY